MSPQRVADAAHVSPYPPAIHQGRSTNAPLESSEEGRQSKPKKATKSRARVDRGARPEEERFNIGPRTTRNGRRPFRGGRSDRPFLDVNDGVPNYPPPTFQEAMSTPPLSVCSSTVTLVPLSPLPIAIPDATALASQQSTPQCELTPTEAVNADGGSDSDDSLEIIDGPYREDDLPSGVQLEQRVKQDWLHRRGVEFPSPSSPTPEQGCNKITLPDTPTRGRAVGRKPPALDLVAVGNSPDEQVASPVLSSPKRRFLSLSPLRIFPSKVHNSLDRPVSAHPSPGTSPYIQSSRTATFFRSTTSLATTSFSRLPLTSISPHGRSDSFMSRKFFPLKGKEKAKDVRPPEALESWEELSPEDYQVDHPPSLMSAIASISAASPSSPNIGASPTRSLSFTYGSPTTETFHSLHAPISPLTTPAQDVGANAIHPLSLRDRKVMPTPFVQRQPRRSPAPVPPPIRVEPLAEATGPVVTTVRTRIPQTPPPLPFCHATQPARPSPLSMNTLASTLEEQQAAAAFQRALDTPLPITPIHQVTPDPAHTVRSPAPARPVQFDGGLLIPLQVTPPTSPQNTVFSRAPSPILEEPSTPTRHHYPGRPLPRPPGYTRPLIDSTYASNEDFSETTSSANPVCPEGLLIDLDDPPLTGSSSGNTSPVFQDSLFRSNQPAQSTDNNTTPDLLTPTLESAITPLPALSPTSPSSAIMQSAPDYSEVTDLDLFVSSLTDEQRNGSNYDALLLVADFIGPASPPQRSAGSPSQNSSYRQTTSKDNANISLIGRVELIRRRTTKDGRVKLKLALLDVSVDRCGICLSQFKSGQLAGLTSVCRHAFHDTCLGKWVARNKTCPLCRVPLDADSQ